MSHEALSGNQFGEQLKMFMTPDEVIDSFNKGDSNLARGRRDTAPREQWEHPLSGVNIEDRKKPRSLREEKLKALPADAKFSPNPIRVLVGTPGRTHFLVDGHHRLAMAERDKVPYLSVHYLNND